MSHLRMLNARLNVFRRREDGSILVFGLFLLLLMMMLGGLAVDLMRYEQRRVALQQTVDRAVLAAASLTQDLEPTEVVTDYFRKAGLAPYLQSVTVDRGMNYKIVDAQAQAELDPFFARMVGIDEFDVPADSVAEQRITNVEIVMVLDVSGSMGDPTGATTKIAALRSAAMEFVDTVKLNDVENRVSITIVPYNAQVNIPAALRDKYTITNQHGFAGVNCVEFPSAAFNTLTISRATAYPMYAFADLVSGTSEGTSYVAWNSTNSSSGATMVQNQSFCRNAANNVVRLPTHDRVTARNAINGLTHGGNTSITLGMKWGVAMIDPAARPMFAELIAEGHVNSAYAGRPFDWTDEDAMKIIIVMTDGIHVAHERINDAYKTGLSPIWRSTGDGNYSIRHTTGRPSAAGSNEYWVPHRNEWRSSPWNSGSGVTQQNWEQVWQTVRMRWVTWQLYARALGTDSTTRTNTRNTWLTNFRSTWMSTGNMDTTMGQSCTQAKNNGVIVYGIAFEAPAGAQTVIRNCASSTAHYFNANGLEIQTAFRAIASNISQLRLTQ
jgi:Flp pilus assembly protein TadG